jgi:hypothetical protein
MMSENHTIPITVPCDSNQGTEERLLRTQYLWATVTTKEDREEWFSPNTSHVSGREDMDSKHDTVGGLGWIPSLCTVQRTRFTIILGLEKTKI